MEQALSVLQLNQYIRMRLEQDEILQQVCVSGELSNVTLHRSGHIYLKIKDDHSVISGVMFRFNADRLDFVPKEGQHVIVYGSISVYEPSGSYQIKIEVMKLDGKGRLFAEFEALKSKLSAEGLFDSKHKKKLPDFPVRIGVVTSPTGAAIRDIIQVCARRYPIAEIVLYPSLVQGENSAESLCTAIEWFDANRAADVLIVGRGGGSIEDLWSFNSEALAYSIYNCDIPVVSAVGHEIDFTICDFVADVRAATPSMAAEIVCPDQSQLLSRIHTQQKALTNALSRKTELIESRLNSLLSRPVWRDDSVLVSNHILRLDTLYDRLERSVLDYLSKTSAKFEKSVVKLDALSPLSTLARGYAAVYSQDSVIKSFDNFEVGDRITVKLTNKKADCIIEKLEKI